MATTHDHGAKNQRACPNCGRTREDWPDHSGGGHAKDGVTYCCRGCIEGPGCTCRQYVAPATTAPTQDEIRSDTDSGEFVQSLKRQTDHITGDDYGTDVTKGRPPGVSASND